MKKQTLLITGLSLMLFACSTETPKMKERRAETQKPAQTDIARQVQQKLQEDKLLSKSAATILVQENNGTIVLSGTVESNQELQRVIQAARQVRGVKTINSRLVVRPVK